MRAKFHKKESPLGRELSRISYSLQPAIALIGDNFSVYLQMISIIGRSRAGMRDFSFISNALSSRLSVSDKYIISPGFTGNVLVSIRALMTRDVRGLAEIKIALLQ